MEPDQTPSSYEYAAKQDAEDALSHLRSDFIIPSTDDLQRKTLAKPIASTANGLEDDKRKESVYLCGNSLGLQSRHTASYISSYLATWAQKGVFGHFRPIDDALTAPWVDLDDHIKHPMSKIVGALPSEVAIMETLTANLHILMASFYKPTQERYKIIIEGKAFPSDHYAVLSQLQHHNIPASALITITPPSPDKPYLPTSHILSVLTEHASTTALVLLPGIQYYSGQFLDIPTITAHAHSLGIPIGWDLAHAAGNVPLSLHEWNVDFAAWCNYKYLNSGPGAIGGLFVHERHGIVKDSSIASNGTSSTFASAQANGQAEPRYRPRLSGWWGHDKDTRFAMGPDFVPIPGASGYQLSNPSALDMTAVLASLAVFDKTSMSALRNKSLRLTAYLERLLLTSPARQTSTADADPIYDIITPQNPAERGAQLSVRLRRPGLLDSVMATLERAGVVVDERKPDVVRVAPAPLYNSHVDVWRFVKAWETAIGEAVGKKGGT